MRIHALTYDRGGCFHYRIRQPLDALRQLGHFTTWGTAMDIGTFEQADVLIAQYHYMQASTDQWVEWCENSGKLCVWEVDDDVFQTEQVLGKGGAVYDDPENLRNVRRAISASHMVTVTTPELADIYRPLNANVVVLPNCIPDFLPYWTMPDDRDRYTVGYTCSPSHAADLQAFAPTLAKFMRRLPDTELRFFGPKEPPLGIPKTWRVQAFNWKPQVHDYLRSLSMDVGIAPLANIPFNRGKSGLKAQEYAALGIPVVADSWPQYRSVVIPNKTGILVRSPGQWVEALTYLRDPEIRATMGSAAREHSLTFTQSAKAPEWENAYRKGLESL